MREDDNHNYNHYSYDVTVDAVKYVVRFEVQPTTTLFMIFRTADMRAPIATGDIRPGTARYDAPATLPLELDRRMHELYLDLCEAHA